MRILQVIPYFTPKRGGSISVACSLSIELAARGHSVTIATSDFEFDEDYAMRIREMGVSVIPFECTARAGMFLYTPGMKKWLRDYSTQFDVIHVHNFRSYQSNIVRTVSTRKGVPFLIQAHGSVPMIGGKIILKKLYDLVWGKRVLDSASLLIAVAEMEAEHYRRVGIKDEKVVVIPNGIEIDRFRHTRGTKAFRKKYGIEDKRVILYIGRILKAKRIDALVRSFEILAGKIQDAILVIAGPDEGYRKELEAMVQSLGLESRVIFVDYVEDVAEVYQGADVLVNPASTEIFGLVPFEAIMCGTPVVVSDESGCAEIMTRAECGYVANTSDENQLANVIEEILGNPNEGKALAARGREFIVNNLDWREIAKRFEKAYENCIRDL